MYKHNLKGFYLPSDYIVNMEFGTLYLKSLFKWVWARKLTFIMGRNYAKVYFRKLAILGIFAGLF